MSPDLTLFHIEPDLAAAEMLKEQICKSTNLQHLGAACSGALGLAACRDLEPAIVLLEVQLRDMDGFDLVDLLAQLPRRPRVLLFTLRSDESMLYRSQFSAIAGVVWKTEFGLDDLMVALAEVAVGRTYFPPDFRKATRALASRDDAFFKILSNKEQKLLQHFGSGETDEEIAGHLAMSPATVHTHRVHIMRKLKLDRKDKMIFWAIERGFVQVSLPGPPCVMAGAARARRLTPERLH